MTSFAPVHPSTRIKSSTSDLLKGKRIVLGITGSVAAFLSPQIARELIRHGADVLPVMTKDANRMIGPDLMWWATGNKPITEITGDLEHISLAGVMNEPADLMLIAPSTTNTVAKLATGIGDTTVTLIASSLNGKGIPIMVLCVAHEDLINSPPVQDSLKRLNGYGMRVIDPVVSEGKAKVPPLEDIVYEVMMEIGDTSLQDRDVLVTAGPTREYLDNVRFISNDSSGRMGLELARVASFQQANVHLIHGKIGLSIPRELKSQQVTSTQDMVDQTMEYLENHPMAIVVLSSAMADFTPKTSSSGKIKSGSDMTVELQPTSKLSDMIKAKYPEAFLVLFKAEWDVDEDTLASYAQEKLDKTNADLIIANDLSEPGAGFSTTTNQVLVIDKSGTRLSFQGSKLDVSQFIWKQIISNLKS